MSIKPLILDSSMGIGDDNQRVLITPPGFYVTVGSLPTTCMFTCGVQHVNVRVTREEAKFMGEWLLEQAAK